MSAETLRKAAEKLRALADDAYTVKARTPYSDPEIPPVAQAEWGALVDGYLGGEVGAYCATMHPGVGLALADWLDLVARLLREGFDPNAETAAAMVVARLILGGAS